MDALNFVHKALTLIDEDCNKVICDHRTYTAQTKNDKCVFTNQSNDVPLSWSDKACNEVNSVLVSSLEKGIRERPTSAPPPSYTPLIEEQSGNSDETKDIETQPTAIMPMMMTMMRVPKEAQTPPHAKFASSVGTAGSSKSTVVPGTEQIPNAASAVETASVAAEKKNPPKQHRQLQLITTAVREDERAQNTLDQGPALKIRTILIRPNPVKTSPPSQGTATRFVAPKARPRETNNPRPAGSRIDDSSTVLRDSVSRANSFSSPGETNHQTESSNKQKRNWCRGATDQARQDRETLRKKKEAQELRRQEIQCNFPQQPDYSSIMAPTNAGRNPGDAGDESYDRHENIPQLNNNRAGGAPSGQRAGMRRPTEDEEPQSVPPTPLFERLVTEEVQELKSYARSLEKQNRRLAELEFLHGDLEARLQVESKGRQQLEATLESREREWARQLEHLERDRNEWRDAVQQERAKNTRLMEEVMRKEQEIRRMLQRKYDHEGTRSVRGARGHAEKNDKHSTSNASTRSPDLHRSDFRSPHDILKASGSAEIVRVRDAKNLLLSFFGV